MEVSPKFTITWLKQHQKTPTATMILDGAHSCSRHPSWIPSSSLSVPFIRILRYVWSWPNLASHQYVWPKEWNTEKKKSNFQSRNTVQYIIPTLTRIPCNPESVPVRWYPPHDKKARITLTLENRSRCCHARATYLDEILRQIMHLVRMTGTMMQAHPCAKFLRYLCIVPTYTSCSHRTLPPLIGSV